MGLVEAVEGRGGREGWVAGWGLLGKGRVVIGLGIGLGIGRKGYRGCGICESGA